MPAPPPKSRDTFSKADYRHFLVVASPFMLVVDPLALELVSLVDDAFIAAWLYFSYVLVFSFRVLAGPWLVSLADNISSRLVVSPFVLVINPSALERVSLADNAFKFLLLMALIWSNF